MQVLASYDERGNLDLSILKGNIEKNVPGVTVEGDEFPITILGVDGKYTIEVDEQGSTELFETAAKWDGTKQGCPEIKKENEVYNWYIYTSDELKFLGEFVNNGSSLTDAQKPLIASRNYNESNVVLTEESTVYLMANLDLGGRVGNGTTVEEKWETEANSVVEWTPIGKNNTNMLKATFQGNNHVIRGVYINTENDYNGIFGSSSSTIQNLTIKNSYIKGGNGTGGICGAVESGGKIENCHNNNTTVILRSGIIVGGVIGQLGGNINNCSNSGTIISYGNNQVGGVIGNATSSSELISNCSNTGNVNSNSGIVAGIVSANSNAKVVNCSNTGNIFAKSNIVGGIVGSGGNITIEKCYNTGDITSEVMSAGGIIGTFRDESIKMRLSLCYNSGKITAPSHIGGIAGNLGGELTLCYNKGIIDDSSGINFGGIVGIMTMDSNAMSCFYWSGTGVDIGVGNVSGGNLNLANSRVVKTDTDLNSYQQFLKWIKQYE